MSHTDRGGWHPVPVAIAATIATAIVGTATPLADSLPWYAPGVALAFLAVVSTIAGLAAVAVGTITTWRVLHTAVCLVASGAFASYTASSGWSAVLAVTLLVASLCLVILSYVVPLPPPADQAADVETADRRPAEIRSWEAILHRIVGKHLTVTAVVPWENPDDGEDVEIEFDDTGEVTIDNLTDKKTRGRIGTARRLLAGCTVEVIDGEHQGAATLSVMKRNTITDEHPLDEDVTELTCLDPIAVMHDAKGNPIDIEMRYDTIVVGGATDSGKTTLLDKLIMRGERCPDTLQWVLDLNGGGLAIPHIEPWVFGDAEQPGIDWFAWDVWEGVAMTAVAREVIKARKGSAECRQMMRDAKTDKLPVSRRKPLIRVFGDEMAETKKGRGSDAVVNDLVDGNMLSITEIGRAQGGRCVFSYLRGTGDTATRGIKVQAPTRICLVMNEHIEYSHILGVDPGRTRLTRNGQGWIIRKGDPRPVLGRTMAITPDQKYRHVVETAHLRTTLDDEGRRVAASLRLRDIFPDSLITRELRESQLGRDIEAGLVYENRWQRAERAKLAELRGEQVDPAEVKSVKTAAPLDDFERFRRLTGLSSGDSEPGSAPAQIPPATEAPEVDVEATFSVLTSAEHFRQSAPDPRVRAADSEQFERPDGLTARARILEALDRAHPDGLTSDQLATVVDVSKQRRSVILGELVAKGLVRKEGNAWYHSR